MPLLSVLSFLFYVNFFYIFIVSYILTFVKKILVEIVKKILVEMMTLVLKKCIIKWEDIYERYRLQTNSKIL